MADSKGNLNQSGDAMFHLRRLRQKATKAGVTDIMDFYNETSTIGRSARIVRQAGNQHELFEDNLNDVFVNDMKIKGSCVLKEGDRVTFGQPSEHQFIFETCNCDLQGQTDALVIDGQQVDQKQAHCLGEGMSPKRNNEECKQINANVSYKTKNTSVETSSVEDNTTTIVYDRKRHVPSEIDENCGHELMKKRRCQGDQKDEQLKEEEKHGNELDIDDNNENNAFATGMPINDQMVNTESLALKDTHREESKKQNKMPSARTSVVHGVEAHENKIEMSGNNKLSQLLEKLRAKRLIQEGKIECNETASEISEGPKQGTSTDREIYNRTEPKNTVAHVMKFSIDKHLSSCRALLEAITIMFRDNPSVASNPRLQKWRRDLSDIEKKLIFPKTVIAIVGDTGVGKSSLINALLDHRSVLPECGIWACTAVVVEVVQNTTSSSFEADIEFLQKKEWFDELEVLLKDLTALDGTIKKGVPDSASDAYASYCKVRAVYGRVEPLPILSAMTTLTDLLGTVQELKSNNADDFRRQVEKYIATQDPGSGGQYWPIVRHVRLRLPHCDVCSSGAALVDLPGGRDSNAARDRIAKEYLKNCTAVWIVSSIHRAIDDKTAKDLLGENFRRQLLMDGQYGSIAFICTKTDDLMPPEIIRSLRLEDETEDFEKEIETMVTEKADLDRSIANGNNEVNRLQDTIEKLANEVTELRENLAEIRTLLDPVTSDSQQTEVRETLREYEQKENLKAKEIRETEMRIAELQALIKENIQKTEFLEKRMVVRGKAIAAICAKARNQYSQSQIRRDFKAGLREMKRQAGDPDELDDVNSDDDDGDVGSFADKLRVFCCSATEYQKMRNLRTVWPPQVFSTLEETQIPTLRNYVHEMTSTRQRQSLERLIQSMGSFVSDILLYTSNRGTSGANDYKCTKTVVDNELQQMDSSLEPVLQTLSTAMNAIFDGRIRPKLEEGATNAISEASNICAKWGAPVLTDKTQDKRKGGLPVLTYRATTQRNGVFNSPKYGSVNFNEGLAEPIYRSMTIAWDRAFRVLLWQAIDILKTDVINEMRKVTTSLESGLCQLGIDSTQVATQLLTSANDKLSEMVSQLYDLITGKQRDISRIVIPHVQTSLISTYHMCAKESGPGMLVRMKTNMAQAIDEKKHSMFDEATEKIMQELQALQQEVMQFVKQVCESLVDDFRAAYEPLWEANSVQIREAFQKPVSDIARKMKKIFEDAGLESSNFPHDDETVSSQNEQKVNNKYGSQQQYGVTETRVKTEPMEGDSVLETTEAVYNVETVHIKQENIQGSQQQYGVTETRVKTEPMEGDSVLETMKAVYNVETVHIKQENIQDYPEKR